MDITTKYKVGDKVFTIDKKTLKVLPIKVMMVCANVDQYGKRIHIYPEGGKEFYDERLCFETEEKLIQYITDYGDHKELF